MAEELLNSECAAQFLKVSIYVIRRHIRNGNLIPDERTRTGELRFSKKTLLNLEPHIGKRGRPKQKG